MYGEDKGLVLVSVVLDGRKASISLDDRLFMYLSARLGSDERAVRWLRAETQYQDRTRQASGVKSGLSRLVQRRSLDVLIGGEPFGHGFDPQTEESAPADAAAPAGEGGAPAAVVVLEENAA
jgi:hypothetical protein